MSAVIIIPTRYASKRFPGKALAPLRGATGVSQTLVRRVWDAARLVSGVDAVYVATDDERIEAEAKGFGADVVMTSVECQNGTERCAAALDVLGITPEIVINLQGDAPLTPPWFVEALIEAMRRDPEIPAATPAIRCDGRTLAELLDDRRAGLVGGTTVVFDHHDRALYFSKEVIPHTEVRYGDDKSTPVFHHAGLYAYRPDVLAQYRGWRVGALESLEGLEQLRFLENGVPMRVVEVDPRGRVFWELNNPFDTERIEDAFLKLEIE